MNLPDMLATPTARTIVHATFVGRTRGAFERLLETALDVGDVVRVTDLSVDVMHYIVTKREPALIVAECCDDVLVLFLTLHECIPNSEKDLAL